MIKKNELDDIAYSTVLKRERNLSLHDVMKFRNLTVWKVRFIMADSRKYRQTSWNVLYFFPIFMGSISVFIKLKGDFGIDV